MDVWPLLVCLFQIQGRLANDTGFAGPAKPRLPAQTWRNPGKTQPANRLGFALLNSKPHKLDSHVCLHHDLGYPEVILIKSEYLPYRESHSLCLLPPTMALATNLLSSSHCKGHTVTTNGIHFHVLVSESFVEFEDHRVLARGLRRESDCPSMIGILHSQNSTISERHSLSVAWCLTHRL
jgi:hypothetical protein